MGEKGIEERLLWLRLPNNFSSAKCPLFFVIMKYLAWEFLKTALLAYENTTFEACILGMSRYVVKNTGLMKLVISFIHNVTEFYMIYNRLLFGGRCWGRLVTIYLKVGSFVSTRLIFFIVDVS